MPCSTCNADPCARTPACGVEPVRPLSGAQARASLLQRLAPIIDKARQVAVNFGLRSRRVFLVWTRWTGVERGEGDEIEIDRLELLPTPKVTGLDAVALNAFSAGILPEGSVRIDLVSALYTEDTLRGRVPPKMNGVRWEEFPKDVSFFYEVVEDGRGDVRPARQKYRVGSQFARRESNVSWSFVLERISEDNERDGASRFAPKHEYGA